ncbi:hypothetical protein HWV07_09180 [Natronomonas salina]|uniref:phage NrS-1 polymerase family protein n=1 Tax=Natronomonas salina TaxID=1710540 RepID=UPI0015B4EE13|nr:hypothetical protein [Natronomonas salina]QLD89195.1 hypothetical protein HWV07_09180 [Natronomonas salina]
MSGTSGQPGEHGWGWADPIPDELLEREQWIVTDEKKPVRPLSGWNTPEKQFGSRRAFNVTAGTHWDPAFVLRPDDPYVVIDLDDVGSPGEYSETVQGLIDGLDTYTEVSRSGTGLHVVCKGARLPDRLTKGQLDGPGTVEVYDANQYVVFTGGRLGPATDIAPGGKTLEDFQREVLPTRDEDGHHGWKKTKPSDEVDMERLSTSTLSLTPTVIRRTIKEYAAGGMEGAKDALRLWESPAGSTDRYSSASEADLALCSHLAFWCQEDASLMDRCFRASSRHRSKWRQVSYRDGRSYGEGTIQVAIASNPNTYTVGKYVVWK